MVIVSQSPHQYALRSKMSKISSDWILSPEQEKSSFHHVTFDKLSPVEQAINRAEDVLKEKGDTEVLINAQLGTFICGL